MGHALGDQCAEVGILAPLPPHTEVLTNTADEAGLNLWFPKLNV